MSSKIQQLRILLWKSFIIRRFHYISMFFEIIGPILLVLLVAHMNSNYSDKILDDNRSEMQNDTIPPRKYSELENPYLIDFLSFAGHKVLFTPDNDLNRKLVQSLVNHNEVEGFNSLDSLEIVLKASIDDNIGDFATRILGIHFENVDPQNGHLKYKILLPATNGALQKLFPFPNKFNQAPREYNIRRDFNLNLVILSSYINREFLHRFAEANSLENLYPINRLRLYRLPYPAYKNPKFSQFSIYDFLALFLLISYVLICPLIVKRITDEKSTKAKELLRMIGMSDLVFWSSHFINHFLVVCLHCFFFTIIFFEYNNPLFVHSSSLLLFFTLILFGIQAILFSMLITTVFNRPVIAVIVTIIIWLLATVLIFQNYSPTASSKSIGNVGFYPRLWTSLLPMGSLFWFITLFGNNENLNVGLNFSNMNASNILYGDFTLNWAIFMTIISYFLYAFFIWYLDLVWPFQHGVPKSPLFLFERDYWSKTSREMSNGKPLINDRVYEPDPKDLVPTIEIRDITKIFSGLTTPKKIAVENLWLNIYNNQLTVLLGHNGAGKTTTMNMLTGMFKSTSGKIFINNHDVMVETNKARECVGLCPQENILFKELTVYQHLKLFAVLKGLLIANVDRTVNSTLADLQLLSKRDVLATNLSGGMKRKLQLGMAMIGKTDILILDEPTSGLDPEARRIIWDLLISIRREKTILLTTHYMEEADVLGDRIAIMYNGKLSCCGSPFFLKNAFGTGYQLRIEKTKKFSERNFSNILKQYIPFATLKSEAETEIIYNFNQKSDDKKQSFSRLFEQIEENRDEYGINSFGLSYSTLEDVFLAVDSDPKINRSNETESFEIDPASSLSNIRLTKPSDLLQGFQLQKNQFLALILKRIHYTRRSKMMLLFQLIIPALIIAFAMHLSSKLISLDPLTMEPIDFNVKNLYGPKTESYYQGPIEFLQSYSDVNRRYYENDVIQVSPSKNFEDFIVSVNSNLDQYIKKSIYGLKINRVNGVNDYEIWFNSEQTFSMPLASRIFFETLLNMMKPVSSDNRSIDYSLQPVFISQLSEGDDKGNSSFIYAILSWVITCLILLPIAFPFLAASYVLFPVKEHASKAKLIQLMTGLSPTLFWMANFVWDLFFHLMAIAILFIVIYLFDSTKLFFEENSKNSAGILFTLLFSFGFATIPLAYLVSFFFNLASSAFVFLVIVYLIFGLIANIFFSVFDLISMIMELGDPVLVIKIILNFSRLSPIFSMLYGYQKIFKANSFTKICHQLGNQTDVLCEFPTVSALVKGCCPNICEETNSCYNSASFSFGQYGAGYEILYLCFVGLFSFIALIIFENYRQYFYKYCDISMIFKTIPRNSHQETDSSQASLVFEDSDVIKEKERVETIIADPIQRKKSDLLIVHNLTKNFHNLTAVDHLSFVVKSDECFGLLGVNGAGKTTTFSMLTGDLFPSKGNAYIKGNIDLSDNLKKFQQNIGYCPQFDALLDYLTGEETLKLMASLRGVPRKNIDQDVGSLIRMIDLQAHAKKITDTYSGGNKRKLSIAMSLIGNPSLLLLDEPTCGVDPSARRKVWKTLEFIRENFKSAIILTSHSMEECEALCSRIGIMVSGKFRCLGSTQHLRSVYGQGYTIVIRLKRQYENDLEYSDHIQQKVQETIPSAKLTDYHQCLFNFHIKDSSIRWSVLFEKMYRLNEQFQFEDYIVCDTTLESIFIQFARSQAILCPK